MPNDYIDLNTTTNQRVSRAARFARLIREVRDLGEEVKSVLDHHTDGVDWTAIETAYGLSTGEGETFYNLIAGAYSRVNHADVTNLIDRVGEQ